ncbi:MAG: toxin-antitoxin system protein [Bacteroidales bacterium]|nr:toxin-antitoxin system protein [Bacteroidales bacterium]
METTIRRRQTSFRLRIDLLNALKAKAEKENRTLNNYVESVLLDIVYDEPNEVTKAAIEEAMNRKEYPTEGLYDNVEDLFKALDKE